MMSDVLEDLLSELEALRDVSGVWAEGQFANGYTLALGEAMGLVREQIQIQKLGE
jgi:hypothetical protein